MRSKVILFIGQNARRKYSTLVVLSLLIGSAIAFGMEFIARGSLQGTLDWIGNNSNIAFLNAVIIFAAFIAIYSLIGCLFISAAVTSLLLFLVAFISFLKVNLLGEPFFPWDIMLNKEGVNIAPIIADPPALKRIALILFVVLGCILVRMFTLRLSMPIIPRIVLGTGAIIILYSFGVRMPWTADMVAKAGVTQIAWNQKENYKNNGLAFSFAWNVKNAIVSKPEGYGEAAMAALSESILKLRDGRLDGGNSLEQQPNVIFIMNEAFWDPTLMPNIAFSEDPIPTVHRLQKESTSGYLLSPQFGGGTSNVEFEVLTGMSMSFLAQGAVPYQQYIGRALPSLASYFSDQGYKSQAIHSYEGWFWNRDQVYRHLGFESFQSIQYFNNPERKGHYISDDEVSRQIIAATKQSDRPMFIYAVTMQNHGPYDDRRYGDSAIQAEGALTDQAKRIAETYAQGARDADRSLQMLIDHFEEAGEPTVIVFYGDHLPMLGVNYEVYKQGGFVPRDRSWNQEELRNMHSTPLVVWSNLPLPKQEWPVISASFLGGRVLDLLGLELPPPHAYTYELGKQLPGLLRSLTVTNEGELSQEIPEALKPLVDRYEELQYDLLFGKRYLARYMDQSYLTKLAMENYNIEFTEAAQ